MALTTAAETRATLGIDEALAHETFRYASSLALDTAVTAAIARAEAWLKSKADSDYYDGTSPGPSSTDIDELFKGAEEYAAGHFLMPRLKVRRIIGTHFALDQEDSSRFEELIDVELLKLAEELVEPYLVTPISDEADNFTPGWLLVTEPYDVDAMQTVSEEYQDQLDRALGFGLVMLP